MLLAHAEIITNLAKQYDIEPAVLMAVVEVESNGQVFGPSGHPIIRWEGHYFDRLVDASKRDVARKAGLAHPTAGKIPNPASQEKRYQLLNSAMQIDRVAALSSISIGVGQVMGSHWEKLGFANVDEMFQLATTGFAGQVETMVRYIEAFGLIDELQRRDFKAFARGYNGPNYAAGGYHTKMAAAYKRLTGKSTVVSKAENMLRMGSKGAAVRELQRLLVRAGFSLTVDGDFGTSTRDAVRGFQDLVNLEVDGVAGPQTMRELNAYRTSVGEELGSVPATDVKEVKEAIAGGVAGAGGLLVLENTLNNAAEKLGAIPGLDLITNGLTIAAVTVSIVAVLHGTFGWVKAQQ